MASTFFSAEEEALISLLHRKGVIVIGVYASEKKAYRASFREGNLYQASVDFLLQLQRLFKFSLSIVGKRSKTLLVDYRMLEARYDFSQVEKMSWRIKIEQLSNSGKPIRKRRVEFVAKSIRQRLHDGARYRDIRVLLGDGSLSTHSSRPFFDQYQIPFCLGRSEAMVHHPLIQVIESLEAIKQFNYQTEDVINLLKEVCIVI